MKMNKKEEKIQIDKLEIFFQSKSIFIKEKFPIDYYVLLRDYSLEKVAPYIKASDIVDYIDAYTLLREATCLLDIIDACIMMHDIIG